MKKFKTSLVTFSILISLLSKGYAKDVKKVQITKGDCFGQLDHNRQAPVQDTSKIYTCSKPVKYQKIKKL